jgi:hypothetical protein
MTDQLEVVRPMLTDGAGQAVVWLGGSADKLWVSVAMVDKDRAVIRMVDLPREPDPLPRLAMAVRELVATAYSSELEPEVPTPLAPATPPILSPPPASSIWWAGIAVGSELPMNALAGGPRGAARAQLYRDWGRWQLGSELVVQQGASQGRLGLGLGCRSPWLTAGITAEWLRAEWALPVQPRAYLGIWHRWDTGIHADLRAVLHPIRDQVAQEDLRLYDSGWSGLGIFVGWERKISTP